MSRARTYIPAAILALGCVLTLSSRQQQSVALGHPLSTLPRELDGFVGKDITISDEEQRVAGMSSYVYRVFQRDSMTGFSVYVGYYPYQTQGKSIHSPKNCLPGAGWDFMETGRRVIATPSGNLEINRSVVHNGAARALVYYWYQGRGRVAANEYRVKWDLLRDAALHGRTEEALVRIVVPILAGSTADSSLSVADARATSVAGEMIREVSRVMPGWPST